MLIDMPESLMEGGTVFMAFKDDNSHKVWELDDGKILVVEEVADYGTAVLCFEDKDAYLEEMEGIDWIMNVAEKYFSS